ncbi:MAG: peptide transporter, partial [Firmicutes bacterium]|nr:peptide transporter [Bacillota bacterium]
MWRVLLQRVLMLLPVLFIVGTVVFLLIHLTPGDPAAFMLGPDATPADVDRLRSALGLDRPLPVQYAQWMYRAVQGDLGASIFLRKPVPAAILERL